MRTGAITGYIDVAQLVLYAFWIFFAGLIYYLRREDKREGYPLESDRSGARRRAGLPGDARAQDLPARARRRRSARRSAEAPPRSRRPQPDRPWPGAPLEPDRQPDARRRRPGCLRRRADMPDLTVDGDAEDRAAARRDRLRRGARGIPIRAAWRCIGADGNVGGTVRDMWVDRAEMLIRYLEVEVGSGGKRRVLLPINFAASTSRGRVSVRSILGQPVRRRARHCATPTRSPCSRRTRSGLLRRRHAVRHAASALEPLL